MPQPTQISQSRQPSQTGMYGLDNLLANNRAKQKGEPTTPYTQPNPSGGTLPEYNNPNYNFPGVSIPKMNPQLPGTFQTQLGQAKDYDKNMKSESDTLYNSYAQGARQGLASTIAQNKNAYNSRGLLNSGGTAAANAGAVADTNANLDQARTAINSGLIGSLNQMEGNAAQTGAVSASPGPNIALPYLGGVASNIGALTANQGLLNSIYGSLGQGAGALGGYGLAQMMQNPNAYLGLNNPNNVTNITNTGDYGSPYGYGVAGGVVA